MTQKKQLMAPEVFSAVLFKRMLIGTLIGLAVISFFIFRVPNPKPEWGELWRVRPLIITPLAGAACGACYHLLSCLMYSETWKRTMAVALGVLVYIVGLWLGIVLGLNGTMWN